MSTYFCNHCGTQLVASIDICPTCGQPHAAQADIAASIGGFLHLATLPLKRCTNLSGRASRKEYFYFLVFVLTIRLLAWLIAVTMRFDIYFVDAVLKIIFVIPSITVGVRRMHDSGNSGFLLLIPVINLYLLCKKGNPGPNRFGPNPLYDT